jgi:hypothetical protein
MGVTILQRHQRVAFLRQFRRLGDELPLDRGNRRGDPRGGAIRRGPGGDGSARWERRACVPVQPKPCDVKLAVTLVERAVTADTKGALVAKRQQH